MLLYNVLYIDRLARTLVPDHFAHGQANRNPQGTTVAYFPKNFGKSPKAMRDTGDLRDSTQYYPSTRG